MQRTKSKKKRPFKDSFGSRRRTARPLGSARARYRATDALHSRGPLTSEGIRPLHDPRYDIFGFKRGDKVAFFARKYTDGVLIVVYAPELNRKQLRFLFSLKLFEYLPNINISFFRAEMAGLTYYTALINDTRFGIALEKAFDSNPQPPRHSAGERTYYVHPKRSFWSNLRSRFDEAADSEAHLPPKSTSKLHKWVRRAENNARRRLEEDGMTTEEVKISARRRQEIYDGLNKHFVKWKAGTSQTRTFRDPVGPLVYQSSSDEDGPP